MDIFVRYLPPDNTILSGIFPKLLYLEQKQFE